MGSSANLEGGIDSNNLLLNLENRRELENSGENEPFRTRLLNLAGEDEDENRPLSTYILLLVVLLVIFGFNFFPFAITEDGSTEDSVGFSTYYTTNYRICLNSNSNTNNNTGFNTRFATDNNIKFNTENNMDYGTVDNKDSNTVVNKECRDGNLDVVVFVKGLNLEGFYRVYACLSFELDYSGKWFEFWKKPHFFSSKHPFSSVILGFSNVYHIDELKASGPLYLNSFAPNFINRDKSVKGGILSNGVRLNEWNEFAKLGEVDNYSLILNLKLPIESAKESKSYRKLDDFYLLNLRKFVHNEFEHTANFDISTFNIFNVFSTRNPISKFLHQSNSVNTSQPSSHSESNTVNLINSPNSDDTVQPSTNTVGLVDKDDKGESSEVLGDSVKLDNIVDGVMYSENVSVKFKGVEKDMRVYSKRINNFYIAFIFKTIAEILLSSYQFKALNQAQYANISIVSVSLMTFQEVFEVFLLLFHSNVFFSNIVFFLIAIFLKFFFLAVIQHSFIVLIWRSTHSFQIRQGWNTIQLYFTIFYRYYFTFIFLLLITWYYYYDSNAYVLCLVYLVWVPQIMLDVWRGQNNGFSCGFVLVLTGLKLALPLYVFYFSENVFNFDKFGSDYVKTNRGFVYFLLLLNLTQLIVILSQRLYGPRHLANWAILPKIYSDWYLTPCDHLFHKNCLKEWTSIKMECPNCRRQLPPII